MEGARVRGKADQQIPGVGNACGCQQLCRDNAEMHENHGLLVKVPGQRRLGKGSSICTELAYQW